MKSKLYLLIIIFVVIAQSAVGQVVLQVNSAQNPNYSEVFSSPSKAIEAVRELRQNGEESLISINLEERAFRLKAPILINEELGPLKILGKGKNKTILKGSKLLEPKWTKYNDNILVAKLDHQINFDQIYVDGEQQHLARYPNYDANGGHWQGHAADAISAERVKSWKNPKGAIIHAMHRGEWGGFHYLVEGVDENGELELSGGHQNNRPSEMHAKYRMVENVLEELDAPGEWFLDEDSQLYFWPTSTFDQNTSMMEAAFLDGLIRIEGREDKAVKDISISGIGFQHTKRTLFKDYEPLLRSDWTIYRGGAVFISRSENVKLTDCKFSDLGGNAVFISKYNRQTEVTRSHFVNCGATAVNLVGNPEAVRSPSFQYGQFVDLAEIDTIHGPKGDDFPSECLIDNNLIHSIGRIEKQTAGVNISMAMDITVSNNSIYDVPRAGVNICDGTWGGHVIEYNDVFNTVLESGDHGAFNSWGRDRFWHPKRGILDQIVNSNPSMAKWDAIHTTIIRNNRFRCDHGWDIDLDDGSSNYEIYNNVCLNGGLKLREGLYRTVENNILVNNGFHPHVWFENSEDVFRKNIAMTEHKDIRLSGWGKDIDYNLFPNLEALADAQKHHVDANSDYGNPEFIDTEKGNYSVESTSKALQLGFKNFESVEAFGVKDPELKALAEKPEFPQLWNLGIVNKGEMFEWLGSKVKNIETMEERSAAGLSETSGVLVVEVAENSVLSNSDIQRGDVIISSEGKEVNSIPDLMRIYQGNNWKGVLHLTTFRNQTEQKVTLQLKK
jgi:hypothetical protein